MLRLVCMAGLVAATAQIAEAQTLVCRAAGLQPSVTLTETACAVGTKAALRRDTDRGVECRLSNPQLRIIVVSADGGFTYTDTDEDRTFTGRCGPD